MSERDLNCVFQQVVAQEEWLDRQLEIARSSSTPSVMFQHVPWFHTDPESKTQDYFQIEYTTRHRIMEKLLAAGIFSFPLLS